MRVSVHAVQSKSVITKRLLRNGNENLTLREDNEGFMRRHLTLNHLENNQGRELLSNDRNNIAFRLA